MHVGLAPLPIVWTVKKAARFTWCLRRENLEDRGRKVGKGRMEASWNVPGAPQLPLQWVFSTTSSPSGQGSSPVLPSFALSEMDTEALSKRVQISVYIRNYISIHSMILKVHIRHTFLQVFFLHVFLLGKNIQQYHYNDTRALSHDNLVFIHHS